MKINKTVSRCAIVVGLFFTVVTSQGRADQPLPELNMRDVLGEDIWHRAQTALYQTLFNKLADIDLKIHDNDDFRWDLHMGRILLRVGPQRLFLADHFGITGNGGIPVGGLLDFGGYLSASLLRVRQVNDSLDASHQQTLKDSLSDWNPLHKVEDTTTFQKNITPMIETIENDVKAGNYEAARQMFGDDIPEKKYLDLLADLKLPFEMPWTSKRLLNEKVFHTGDLAAFAVLGGIFARLGGNGIGDFKGPWAALFLRGQFRYGILKTEAKKAIFRVESMKEQGYNYNLFDVKFRVTIGHGVVFGQKIQPSFRPINITGQNYNSRLFARTYSLDFDQPQVAAAYDAALHGNLTVLDDLALVDNSGVKVISERYTDGHYNQSQFNISFGPIEFDNSYTSSNVEKDFWDERGVFTMFSGAAIRANYDDINIGLATVRRTRTNDFTVESFTKAPAGPFPPRLTWDFEEVNFAATQKDQNQLRNFIESLKPLGLMDSEKRADLLGHRTKFRVDFHIEAHPNGVREFESRTVDQVWQAASQVLFNDPKIWQDAKSRSTWLSSHFDHRNYNQVSQWASAFRQPIPVDKVKDRFSRLLTWQRSTAWDALGVRLFLQLMSPENRYLKLEFVPESGGEAWRFENGQADLTAYPDDWEYLNIPDVIPHP